MRILIVEDDAEASDYLAKGLAECGYCVDQVEDGLEALTRGMHNDYAVLIVDRMIPSLDGLTLIETLRKSGITTPVLILSALSDVSERVKGLRSGGDDYVTKPFAFSEVSARIDALTRRGNIAVQQSLLKVEDLELDLLARRVTRAGREIQLQPREFTLLEYLIRHAGQVVTRTMLLENVWHYHFDPQTNVVDVHISRLRKKVDSGSETQLIHTVRGAGYCIRGLE